MAKAAALGEKVRSTAQKRDEKGRVRHGAEWLAIWSDPNSLKSAVEKCAEEHALQTLREIANNIAATVRSLSGRPDLDVQFGEPSQDTDARITLPALDADLGNLAAVRGACDAKASFLLHHNPNLAEAAYSDDKDAARLHYILEQSRCTALVARKAPGITQNLVAAQKDRLQRASLFDAHLASLIPLAEALQMVARDCFHNANNQSLQTSGFRMWDQWLRARYQTHFDAMANTLPDQAAFSRQSWTFLRALLAEISASSSRPSKLSPTTTVEKGHENLDQLQETDNTDDAILFEPGDALFLDDDAPVPPARSIPPPSPYRPFTTAHDLIAQARDLPGLSDLRETRRKLDEKQSAFRQEMTMLVARLKRRLLAQRLSRWEFDLDEGMIDAARLDRVIVNPGFGSAYKQEIQSPIRDTCVTLLIDNSGSMRGKQIETACVVADILAATLEKCGIVSEVLGYTTRAWKGGQSGKDWAQAGKPENPGRLNDLLHIIYKDGDTSLRHARDAICAMLEPSVLKENIDGEALLWAETRLMARLEARKLLIVVSDGAPVDQATVERNSDEDLLDRHLCQVVSRIENTSPIQLAAIGIRHDVSPYFSNSTRIDKISELGQVLIDLLDAKLT